MRLMTRLLGVFFHHFYHSFAWTYDAVAATVSLGRWNLWIAAVLPYLAGQFVLELGFGTGYLQERLHADASLQSVGLDESRQMASLAKRRLRASGYARPNLIRGLATNLPFSAGIFDSVVATFPTEYISNLRTLNEVHRVLRDGGRFVVIPAAWITGSSLTDRSAAWLFAATHQAPRIVDTKVSEKFGGRLLQQAGFEVESNTVEINSSLVLIVTAYKKGARQSHDDNRSAGAIDRPAIWT